MGWADIGQFHLLAAEIDRHLILKGDVGDRRRPFFADDGGPGVFMGDDGGAVKDLTAGDVVAVVVAVDQILDGFVEAFLDFRLQVLGGIGIDRISDNDARIGDQEDRKVEIILKPVEITGNFGDRSFRRFLLGLDGAGGAEQGQNHKTGTQPAHNCRHQIPPSKPDHYRNRHPRGLPMKPEITFS